MNVYSFHLLKENPTNWGYVLILIILTILVGGGILSYSAYVFEKMTTLVRFPEIRKIKSETADWKTYRNENFRIEFKYPRNWVISKENKTLITFRNVDKSSQEISILKSSGPPPETMRYKLIESKFVLVDKIKLNRELFQGGFEGNKDDYYVRVFISEKAILYQGDFKKEGLEEFLSIYNQILSTFRFWE